MPADTHVAVPPPGPELDAEVWTLLGYPRPSTEQAAEHKWDCGPWGFLPPDGWVLKPDSAISTDPGAAFRALEMWRGHDRKRYWWQRSPQAWPSGSYRAVVRLCEWGTSSIVERQADTLSHAVALALRAALRGGK